MRRSWRLSLLSVLPMLVSVAAAGQQIPNWHAPPTWTPPRPAGAISVMTDIGNPLPFIAVNPCRIADTRGLGFSGQAGPPALTAGTTRTFEISGTVTGVPAQCGIPLTARAVSFQFTVIQPGGEGNLIAWPSGPAPGVSVLNWAAGIFALGNGIVVPIDATVTPGKLRVLVNAAGGVTTQLTIDVNGYYYDSSLSTGALGVDQYFGIIGNRAGGPMILGRNTNAAANSYGIQGETTASGSGSAGVYGLASATSGTIFGALGKSSSTAIDSAGVKGVDGTGSPANATSFQSAGVRGESALALGVLGVSAQSAAVQGTLINPTTGAALAEGKLGHLTGGTYYGVYSATGEIGGTGMKFFVVPHPTNPALVIRYVSLEGPEAGTYFRGRGTLENGKTVINVPESFRLVTEEEGLTIQVTPLGRPGDIWVEELTLDRIAVRGLRDVGFSYTVNGVRRGYGAFQPLVEGAEFMPESAAARLPEGLSPETSSRLISNGTYNPDGSVNLETAERMGWTSKWAQQSRQNP